MSKEMPLKVQITDFNLYFLSVPYEAVKNFRKQMVEVFADYDHVKIPPIPGLLLDTCRHLLRRLVLYACSDLDLVFELLWLLAVQPDCIEFASN